VNSRLRRHAKSVIFISLLALAVAPAPPLGASGLIPGGAEVERLLDPRVTMPELPRRPEAALAEAVSAFGASLGFALQPEKAIAAAGLPPAVVGRLALLTDGLLDCYRAAAPARGLLGAPWVVQALTTSPVLPPPEAMRTLERASKALRLCAGSLQSLALETSRFLASAPAGGGEGLDLWPVLRYSPGSAANRYPHDYALLVDEGGDDVYLNNAGGSLLDGKRSPSNSIAARGCHKVAQEFPPGNLTPEECFAGVALLIDLAGNDTYGARQAPDPADDGRCTADPIVRRIDIVGAGLAGVGILIERAGNDHYVGKTGSQGSGHLAGVGILRDEGGDDSYLAIRNAQGYALLGGFGLLRDEGGNDIFDRYMPGPLDPEAENQRPGAGGVTDDRGTCDTLARQLQGSGFLMGALGVLANISGNDTYRGAPPATQDFGNDFEFPHGSQGFGANGGAGALMDEGGHDVYAEVPGRADGKSIDPGPDSAGIFRDSGS
jgi:hypothetical protein